MKIMRRQEREVIGRENLEAILKECRVMRCAFVDREGLYIVPVNFGYAYADGGLELYFHGARTGRKAEAAAGGPIEAAFEMDCEHELVTGAEACRYSYLYASIIGQGTLGIVADPEEAAAVMNILMEQQAGKPVPVSASMLSACYVYRIRVSSYTGKRHSR